MSCKISIITVCYNSAQTIEKTIQSVMGQTYKNIEYIIVDGLSTDSTVNTIQKYDTLSNIKWVSEKDSGLYDAMNKGIQMSTGDYVGILNSDDTFHNDHTVEQVVGFLTENSGIDAIIGDIVQHRKDGKVVRRYSSKNWAPDQLKTGFMPPHPSLFVKRSLFEKYGLYSLGYKIAADYELIIRYFLKNKISYKYSGITTTAMLVGGASSSGLSSYKIITTEIKRAFAENSVPYSPFKVKFRIFQKLFDYIKK